MDRRSSGWIDGAKSSGKLPHKRNGKIAGPLCVMQYNRNIDETRIEQRFEGR